MPPMRNGNNSYQQNGFKEPEIHYNENDDQLIIYFEQRSLETTVSFVEPTAIEQIKMLRDFKTDKIIGAIFDDVKTLITLIPTIDIDKLHQKIKPIVLHLDDIITYFCRPKKSKR